MNSPAVSESEALLQMIADLTDIPANGRSEDISENRSNSILQNLLDRIDSTPARVCTDAHGHITSINPAFSQLCGHAFEDLKGRKPGSMLQGPESSPDSIEVLRKAIREQTPCVTELVNYHKDHSAYRVRIHLRPLFSASGELTGYEAEEHKLD
jgi:PAS domain S-box-containing protein